MSPTLLAFSLTLLAGLSTGIGSAIAFFARRDQRSFLAASLGFSAGVMIYISFVEIHPYAMELLVRAEGAQRGPWLAALGFFGGMLAIALIDWLVPSHDNPHEAALVTEMGQEPDHAHLHRLGILSALAIGIHNFPEGIATFFSALADPTVGIPIAIAIGLHNIPEGISVSVPVYFATGSRRKAFWWSFVSGISEPVGALVGYLLLRPVLTDAVLGMVDAAVAGVMVFISLDQLIPNAKKYGRGHHSVYGLLAGMAIMALTLLLL